MGDTPALRFLRLDDGEFDSAPGQAINSRYLADEKAVVSELLALVRLPDADREAIRRDAIALVVAARSRREGKTGIESFLQQYGLASQEGVVLMSEADAVEIAQPPPWKRRSRITSPATSTSRCSRSPHSGLSPSA